MSLETSYARVEVVEKALKKKIVGARPFLKDYQLTRRGMREKL